MSQISREKIKTCSCGQVHEKPPETGRISKIGMFAECHVCGSTLFWPSRVTQMYLDRKAAQRSETAKAREA